MESLFSNVYAEEIQLLSLPLEIWGFLLAFIEVFFPKLADKIEGTLDKYEEFADAKKQPYKFHPEVVAGHFLKASVYIILIGVWFGVFRGPSDKLFVLDKEKYGINLGLFFFMGDITTVFLFLIASLILFPQIIRKLNKVSKGKALGTIGFMIALLGVLGEFYQVITMLWYSN